MSGYFRFNKWCNLFIPSRCSPGVCCLAVLEAIGWWLSQPQEDSKFRLANFQRSAKIRSFFTAWVTFYNAVKRWRVCPPLISTMFSLMINCSSVLPKSIQFIHLDILTEVVMLLLQIFLLTGIQICRGPGQTWWKSTLILSTKARLSVMILSGAPAVDLMIVGWPAALDSGGKATC